MANREWGTRVFIKKDTRTRILCNKKYIGDALLQKTYTTDFLNKTRAKNTGIVPQYYVEGAHEAIIPKELYWRVQEEMARRKAGRISPSGKKRKYSSNNGFSCSVICGECGDVFHKVYWYNHEQTITVWRCASRPEGAGGFCNARTVSDAAMKKAVLTAFNALLQSKESYTEQLMRNMEKVVSEKSSAEPPKTKIWRM